MHTEIGTVVTTRTRRPRFLPAVVAAAVFLALAPLARAQTDDFNDGNDTGWTRYSPLAPVAPGQFSFPDGGYRIVAPGSPDPANFGPGRAGSFRNDASYSRFYAAVDIIDWDDTLDQSFGLLARIDPASVVGPGMLDGYAFTYSNRGPSIDISKVTNEEPDEVAAMALTLAPGGDYRLVFEGNGDELRGAVYALTDLATPLGQISGIDNAYGSGIGGLVVFDNGSGTTGANATFDNYSAGVVPEPGSVGALLLLSAGALRRSRRA